MTDLEATKLCALAMYTTSVTYWGRGTTMLVDRVGLFDPLREDAHAMALVKRFPYECLQAMHNAVQAWIGGGDYDLNRAIVEAVARMQAGK